MMKRNFDEILLAISGFVIICLGFSVLGCLLLSAKDTDQCNCPYVKIRVDSSRGRHWYVDRQQHTKLCEHLRSFR
jgi:hypothetical protein